MANFNNSKAGDKVYHLDYGECEIYDTSINNLYITPNNMDKYSIKRDSKCIYHSKPQIIEAKRMVKKEVDVFIDINFHKTDTIQTLTYKSGSICYPAKLTFEVEE